VGKASDDGPQCLSGGDADLSRHRRRARTLFEELLDHPDIDDMFYVPYPAGTWPRQPSKNFDPGRVRFEPLFLAMYGDCKKNEVMPKLRLIDWLPAHSAGRVAVSTVNDNDISALPVIDDDGKVVGVLSEADLYIARRLTPKRSIPGSLKR